MSYPMSQYLNTIASIEIGNTIFIINYFQLLLLNLLLNINTI